MKRAKKLSLRPYSGNLYVCTSEEAYQHWHNRLFGNRDVPLSSSGIRGRFSGGCGPDGNWTYLIYYEGTATLAHELSHCIFCVFERCGINPSDSGGEAFCYMLETLMREAMK